MDAPRPAPVFRAQVDEQGRLRPREAGRFAGYLAKLRGRDVEVMVRPERKHRSLSQNAYFHGVVVPCIAEWSGMTQSETKDGLKRRFLLKTVVLPTGEEMETVPSTRDLDMEQFSSFLSECIAWAGQSGCPVPTASEVL